MCRNKQIADADSEAVTDVTIDLETGLLGVRYRAFAFRIAVSDGSRFGSSADNAVRHHLAGAEEIGGKLCRSRHTRYRYVGILVQLVHRALGAYSIRRQIRIGKNSGTL